MGCVCCEVWLLVGSFIGLCGRRCCNGGPRHGERTRRRCWAFNLHFLLFSFSGFWLRILQLRTELRNPRSIVPVLDKIIPWRASLPCCDSPWASLVSFVSWFNVLAHTITFPDKLIHLKDCVGITFSPFGQSCGQSARSHQLGPDVFRPWFGVVFPLSISAARLPFQLEVSLLAQRLF